MKGYGRNDTREAFGSRITQNFVQQAYPDPWPPSVNQEARITNHVP